MLLLNKAILIILCSLTTRVSLLENNSNLTNSSPPPSQDLHHRRVEIIKTDTWDPKLKERWNAFLEKRGREIAFDSTSSSLNITSVAGKDVYLTCALNKPIRGKYKISLMRLRDLNLLAVDKSLHTKDPRMEILKSSLENRVWTLKIRDAVPEDSGLYECHLNSIPKSKTLLLSMTIIEGRIRILPTNHVLHLNVGSDLNLTCVVESGPVQPKYIHWYHKNILLQYAENSPATIKSNFNQIGGELNRTFHSSSLFISSLSPEDSGEYKCGSDLTGEVCVKVYVVQEDLKTLHLGTAAVDGGEKESGESSSSVFGLSCKGYFHVIMIYLTSILSVVFFSQFHYNP